MTNSIRPVVPSGHNQCLFCKMTCFTGEWYCEKCNERKAGRIVPDKTPKSSVPARSGTIENSQYSGDRPVAQGRVGDFPPLEPKEPVKKTAGNGHLKDAGLTDIWGDSVLVVA